MSPDARDVRFDMTQLLREWQSGDKAAESVLFSKLQQRLKEMCGWRLAQVMSPKLTLRSTEMLNELYLRLEAQSKKIKWENRKHFFFIAGRLIRQIIVDEVRRKKAKKRKGEHNTYNDIFIIKERPVALDELDLALEELERKSPELARMTDLRFFIGLNFTEISEILEMTEAQAKHRWHKAKIWLLHYLGGR